MFPRRSQLRKKLKRKFDGINTQVVAWITNKCRGKMVQGDYIMGNIFHKKMIEKLRKNNVVIKIAFILCLLDLYEHLSPRT